MASKTSRQAGGLSQYHEQSRDLFNSLVLVIPLFVLYQVGVLALGGLRNGVDFVTQLLFELFQDRSLYLAFNGAILAGLAVALFVLRKKSQLHPRIWVPVLVESTVYALALSAVINTILRFMTISPTLAIGELSATSKFFLSLGAGLYEELVFRLLLLSGMVWIFQKVLGISRGVAVVVAVILSSAIFSAIHYVGVLGDPFSLHSFLFRFWAGVLFAGIYATRGFAVAVYTHAIYDLLFFFVFS
jgi:hypothetical protein